MFIGLTGKVGSGKGEVAKILKAKGFEFHSLSDVIREKLRKENKEITRENLIRTGNALRKRFGDSILAKKVINKLNGEAIIDSIRNPAEVNELRKLKGFCLVGVESPLITRFERMMNRKRNNELHSLREFKKLDDQKGKSELQVGKCLRMADCIIKNTGTLEELKEKVERMFNDLVVREKIKERKDRDGYFLKIASVVAERSTCRRHNIGAIAVKDNKILATGYNGAAADLKDCLVLGCLREQLKIPSGTKHEICRAIHGEQNVIIQCALHGIGLEGATIYCTHSPCILCAKMLVNAKIKRYVTFSDYSDKSFPRLFKEAGIEFVKKKKPDERIKFKL